MKLLAKKINFKRSIRTALWATAFIMGSGLSSAQAAEYYRAIEFQKIHITLNTGTSGLTGPLPNRKIDLKTNYTDSTVRSEHLGWLNASLVMSARLNGGGVAEVKVTLECDDIGSTTQRDTTTFTLAKDAQSEGSASCRSNLGSRAEVRYKIANVQGSAKPACPSKLGKGFVVSESKSSYHSDKLVFTSDAKLTKSTSSECTYSGTLKQTWSTSQGSGSKTYEGSVTIPLSRLL